MRRVVLAAVLAGVLCTGCGDDAASPGVRGEPEADGPAVSSDRAGGAPVNGDAAVDETDGTVTDEGSGPILRAPDNAQPADAAGGDGSDAAAAAGSDAHEVRILNWEETLDLVKQHEGKVVVVDLWSHNCLPCLRELPHFAELWRQYPEQVMCIAFNMDYTGLKTEPPESFRDDVAETLGKFDADLIGVVSSVPDIELSDQIGLGAIPAVYVFDQSGKQVKRFDNDNSDTEFTYKKDVVPLVESLLNETAAE